MLLRTATLRSSLRRSRGKQTPTTHHPKAEKRQLLKWQLTFIRLDNKKVLPMPEDGSDLKKPMLHNSTVWYHNCF